MASRQNSKEYPVRILREELRQRAVLGAAALSRSVGRLTSYDILPGAVHRVRRFPPTLPLGRRAGDIHPLPQDGPVRVKVNGLLHGMA